MYSYMRTFPHKVHYKILAVRWVGTRLLMHIFTETTISDKSCMGGLLGMTTKSVCAILQFSKYLRGRLGRSEAYSFEKRVHTLKKISAVLHAVTLFHIFPSALRAVHHGLYTSNLLPMPMCSYMWDCRLLLCGTWAS